MLSALPTPSKNSRSKSVYHGGDELTDRLDRSLADDVKPLALTIDERAIISAALEAHRRQREGLGSSLASGGRAARG